MVDRIGDEKGVAILEGTGSYSYFWKEQLQRKGIFVLVADQGMVKSTRRSLGSTDNKDDEFDARSDVRAVPSVLLRNLRSSVLGQGIKPESTRNQAYIARPQNNHPQANQLYKYRQGTAGMGISDTCHSFDADGAQKRGRRLADALHATCRKLTDKSVSGTLQ